MGDNNVVTEEDNPYVKGEDVPFDRARHTHGYALASELFPDEKDSLDFLGDLGLNSIEFQLAFQQDLVQSF